jgi:LacI family transcriptional regulator
MDHYVNKSRPTLADVAAAASVSRGAVSQALSPRPSTIKLSEATRQRIIAAAERLNYKPDMRARGLVKQRSYLASLLGRKNFDSWILRISRGIEQSLREESYSLLSYVYGDSPQIEDEHLRLSLDRTVDGLFVMPALEPDTGKSNAASLAKLRAGGMPIVQVLMRVTDAAPAVLRDFRAAAQLGVEHLIQLGHRNITLLCNEKSLEDNDPRNAYIDSRQYRQGYLAAIAQAGLSPAIQWHEASKLRKSPVGIDDALKTGYQAGLELLAANPRPTAILCENDFAAYGLLKALHANGAAVPGEISVLATHDEEPAKVIFPSLSSTSFPYEQIGSASARLFFQMLRDRDATPEDVYFNPDLIQRESTAPPSGTTNP